LRFYLKYIAPRLNKIKQGQFTATSIESLPGWETIMGLQFENLVLNNRKLVQQQLGIRSEDIISDNPFFQRKTSKQQGCQIDYLIQTKYNTLFVCEIKFSRNAIRRSIIKSMQEKIARLALPKRFSCIPVLIHVNGLNHEVINSHYFANTIDFGQLLE
jgi:hypothetical protein